MQERNGVKRSIFSRPLAKLKQWHLKIRKSTWVILAGYVLSVLWAWHQLYRYFTWYHFDHGGHAYGGTQFLEVGYHGFQDRVFMGSIQNLFYPPLEDFILAGLQLLSGWTGFEIYPIYVAAVLFFFLASQCSWVLTLQKAWTRICFAAGLLWLFHMQKFESSSLQGWSIFDAVVIGLSSQFLSGIGFFQLLRLAFSKAPPPRTSVLFWTGYCVLSHLITGILAGLLYLVIAVSRRWKRSDLLKGLGTLFAATAFFTLPFLVYKNWMISSTIYFQQSTWVLVLMTLTGGLSIWQRWKGAVWMVLAAILYAPLILFPPLEEHFAWSIPFHFYRLAMPAWILFWSGLLLSADAGSKRRTVRWCMAGSILAGLITLGSQMRPWWDVPMGSLSLKPPLEVEAYPEGWRRGAGGRTLVLGRTRACDFGLDYILLGAFPGFSSIRGLHWEGSNGNAVISSYLVTLFSPPVVLDYFYLVLNQCEEFDRVLKDAIDVFDIGYITYGATDLEWIPEPKRSCWKQVLQNGLQGTPWIPGGGFRFQGEDRKILIVDPSLHARAVFFNPYEAFFATPTGKYPYFGGPVLGRMRAAVDGLSTRAPGIFPENRDAFEQALLNGSGSKVPSGLPQFQQDTKGRYLFDLPSSGAWVHLRVHPQPGMRIRDEAGRDLTLFKAYPGLVFHGAGKVEVEYRRTPWMGLAYAISASFWMVLLFRSLRKSTVFVYKKKEEL